MEVDEDYDDEGEDEKKGGIAPATGSGPGSAGDGKSTPPSAGGNGHTNGLGMNGQVQAKVEATA
jgi:hypothetical protein